MTTVQLSSLRIGDRLADGGQGVVYELLDRPGELFKRYHNPDDPQFNPTALSQLVAARDSITYAGLPVEEFAAWPSAVIVDGSKTVGFLMPRVPEEFMLRIGRSQRLADLSYLAQEPRPLWGSVELPDLAEKLQILRYLAGVVDALHGRGIVLGDMSFANVLWATRPEPRVMIINCDSMRFEGGVSVLPSADKVGWDDPRADPGATPSKDQDRYKLALAILRVASRNLHVRPEDPAARDLSYLGSVGARLQVLFGAAAGPSSLRPAAFEWVAALSDRQTQPIRIGTSRRPIDAPPPPPSLLVKKEGERQPGLAPVADENVQFTVYRPRAVRPDTWYLMLAFAHLAERRPSAPADEPDPIQQVKALAEQALGERASAYASPMSDARGAIPKESELTFVPAIDGVEFNPPRRTFRWLEDVHKEEFRLRADVRHGAVLRGQLTVFLGAFILADVDLVIRVDEAAEPPPTPGLRAFGLVGDQAVPRPEFERSHARPYRKVFPSYSHRDSHIVVQAEHLGAALGDVYLRDRTMLRAGEDWSERLLELIDEADVFQLFWSSNSMRSKYVCAEWEHALTLGRENFIRPTYWESPMPRSDDPLLPPEALRALHFHSLVLDNARPPTASTVPREVDVPGHLSHEHRRARTDSGTQVCPECGEKNRDDARFCGFCGSCLDQDAHRAPTTPAVPPASAPSPPATAHPSGPSVGLPPMAASPPRRRRAAGLVLVILALALLAVLTLLLWLR